MSSKRRQCVHGDETDMRVIVTKKLIAFDKLSASLRPLQRLVQAGSREVSLVADQTHVVTSDTFTIPGLD
jgi:hypothetical protein